MTGELSREHSTTQQLAVVPGEEDGDNGFTR